MKERILLCITFLCLSFGVLMAQVKSAEGVVISGEDNLPIVGASVLVKGTTVGAITDVNGKYIIKNLPASAKFLQISYVGMVTQEIEIKSGIQRTVLKASTRNIDEVVVVAYGTQKKSSFTGSASSVGAKALEKRVITNVTSALEGNASGVQVTSSSGQPGSSAAIRIRGFGSVNASDSPLYVVDGAIYNGNMADINPADIENITILKDAASTSLYGSSAGNGVVLITTKKGKAMNSSSVNLTINQGWSTRAYKDYARVNAFEYYPLQWAMLKNALMTADPEKYPEAVAAQQASDQIFSELEYNPFLGIPNNQIVGVDGRLNPKATQLKWGDDLDWEKATTRTGYRQEYNISYSTKSDKSDTYASLGYLNDKGYIIKTDFERYTARLNYNYYPLKWFKSGVNLAMTRSLSSYSNTTPGQSSSYANASFFVRRMAPIYPIHKHNMETGAYLDREGNPTTDPSKYVYDYDGPRKSSPGRDILAETEMNFKKFTRMSQNGTVYATVTPIKDLNLTVNYSFNNMDYRASRYDNPYVGDGQSGPGRLNLESSRDLTQTVNELITYKRSFGKHNADILLGHENYSYDYEYIYGMKVKETIHGMYEFGNFVDVSSLESNKYNYKKEGYFGRLNYDYGGRYYGSFSYRHDGSSRFSKDCRWGDFWSIGGGWRISEEAFMKNVHWVDNLKLRASYGETGNDAILDSGGYIDYYPYQTLYGLGYTNYNESGAFFTTIANSNLKWETQISSDIAVEFGLFNRLKGSIEYFQKTSKDLLFNVSKPYSTGVTSIIENIGKVKNYGVEVELNYDILKNKDWNFSAGVNGTWLKNEITKLPEEMREKGHIAGSKKWVEGKSMYEFWIRDWWGVNPDNGEGLYVFDTEKYNTENKDLSEDNLKDAMATVVTKDGKQLTNSYKYAKYDFFGSSIPKFFGGFNLKLSYKSWDLAATFSYQLGGKILDGGYASLMDVSDPGQAMSPDLLNAWTKPGQQTDVPMVNGDSNFATNIGQLLSTRFLTKSDYLNMRSLTLGYQLPKNFVNKVLLKNVRLSFTAENLFMLKKRQGLNPMANYSGNTYNEYSPSRNFTFGLNVSF